MILQEDVNFLAHFGKKGMKWGVRNAPKTRPLTPRQQQTRNQRNKMLKRSAVVAGVGVTAAVGILAVSHLRTMKSLSTKELDIGKRTAEELLSNRGSTGVAHLYFNNGTHKEVTATIDKLGNLTKTERWLK